jgi:hypothetical protein
VTFHEYSAAVGTFEDPIYAWAGGGYVSASSFDFYEHDASRGFVSGGHIACAGVGIPLPINWRLPDAPAWGAAAKQNDRDHFNRHPPDGRRLQRNLRPFRAAHNPRPPPEPRPARRRTVQRRAEAKLNAESAKSSSIRRTSPVCC